jgi:prepilin-type N-terminal cleavage/methylation domain-containing protein
VPDLIAPSRPGFFVAGGFTLLEVLVTLVLIALLSSSVAMALGVVGRASAALDEQRRQISGSVFVRQVTALAIEALIVDPELRWAATGDAASLSGLSLQAPFGTAGVPTPIRLSLHSEEGSTRLIITPLGDDGEPRGAALLSALVPARLVLEYRAAAAEEWRSAWPQVAPTTVLDVQLPAEIRLADLDHNRTWLQVPLPAYAQPRSEFVDAQP